MITTLDLFAGIGGFSLGLEATDFFRTTCFVENEPYCQAVLKHHWPDVPVLGDIRDVRREDLPDPNPGLICGGFPCQPFSHAGKQRAQDDPRHLWPEMLRLIRECRPTWVVGENVAGLINLGLDEVLSDLEDEGYATRTFNIPACAVGAPHLRQRLWIVAHSDSESEPDGHGQRGFEFVADTQRKGKGRRRLSGPRKDKGEEGQGPSDKFRGCREDVADADSNDGGRRRGTKSQGREARLEHRSGSARQFERQPQPDVADAKEVHGQWSDSQGSQQRQDKGSLGECGTVVANTDTTRREGRIPRGADPKREDQSGHLGCDGSAHGQSGENWWTVEPQVGRVAHGIPNRVSQLRSLGNSIVPQIAQEIGKAIHAAETEQ